MQAGGFDETPDLGFGLNVLGPGLKPLLEVLRVPLQIPGLPPINRLDFG
jgi:hypothetical protein